ncbi:30S ribosomal protein S31 [Forsythia ovata]|uniref:30S ribosomal protein S31 n=1 Tax=Forsythia ovata TaxID=205694 RepID=A0ABD1X128_9LAMI
MASLLLGASPMAMPMASQFVTLSFSKSQSLFTSSLSTSFTSHSSPFTSPALPSIYCGRGDKKTARGKRFNHSFGNARPKDKKKGRGPPRVPVPPAPPRKDKYDDGEVVKIEIDESIYSN